MNIKCTFTSTWDNGAVITTVALFDPETRHIVAESSDSDPGNDACLEREYITLPDGTELEVCPVCHEFALKPCMNPDTTGSGLHEDTECSNPFCDDPDPANDPRFSPNR
jgi:hypothetical protein